jgi:hypothetical protein
VTCQSELQGGACWLESLASLWGMAPNLQHTIFKESLIHPAIQTLPVLCCRTWLHVDMDAFFAAVHELEQPELVSGCCRRLCRPAMLL